MKFDDLVTKLTKLLGDVILEYRHNLADGTPAPSIHVDNGKNPNRVGPDKKNIREIGPYKRMNAKMNVPGSILTANELADMGITYQHGKIMDNWKNSGFGLQMTSINGEPVARVFKSKPKPPTNKPHLSITK